MAITALSVSRLDRLDLEEWWATLAELYRAEAEAADEAEQRAAHLSEAGRIRHEELGDLNGGGALYREAHALDPHNTAIIRSLWALCKNDEDWTEARRWLTALVKCTEGDSKVDALIALADVLEEKLNERVAAVDCLREALGLSPAHGGVHARLALLVEDDADARNELLKARVETVEAGPQRLEMMLERAELLEKIKADDAGALAVYKSALNTRVVDPRAVDGMVRILLRAGRWQDVIELVEEAGPKLDEPGRRGRLHLMAAVLCSKHGLDADKALPHLAAARQLCAGDTVALLELFWQYASVGDVAAAREMVDRLVEVEPGLAYRSGLVSEVLEGDVETALLEYGKALTPAVDTVPIAAALRRCALRLGRKVDYVSACRELVGQCASPELQASLLTHVGDVLQKQDGAIEQALDAYGQALNKIGMADVSLLEVPAALEERRILLLAHERFEELAEDLAAFLRQSVSPRARARVNDWLAELGETHLGRPDEAISHYEAALEYEPENSRARRAVTALYATRQQWPDLRRSLEGELESSSGLRRLQILDELALVNVRLGEPLEAEKCWRAALAEQPDWMPARSGLGRMLNSHGRWRDLVTLIEAELEALVEEEPARAALLGRVAEIKEFKLEDLPGAARSYEAVLEAKPNAPDAYAGLERTYTQLGRWAELCRVLRSRADVAVDDADRVAILYQVADLLSERIGDDSAAMDVYEEALKLSGTSAPTSWALERLLLEKRMLDRLAILYREQLPRMGGARQEAILRHKLAALLSPAEALETLGPLLEVGDVDALWSKVRDAGERHLRGVAAEALLELSPRLDGGDDREARWLAAEAGLETLNDEAFEKVWKSLLADSRTRNRAIDVLLSRLSREEDPSKLSAFLEELIADEAGGEQAKAFSWWRGLLSERLNDPDGARKWFEVAEAIAGGDPVPSWLMHDRGLDTGLEAANRLARLAELTVDDRRAAGFYHRAGLVLQESGDDPEKLQAYWQSGIERDPTMESLGVDLAGLLRGKGDEAGLRALLSLRLERLESAESRLPVLKALAACLKTNDSDQSELKQVLEEVLIHRPKDAGSHMELGRVQLESGKMAEAIEHLEVVTRVTDVDELLVDAYTTLGSLKARRLGNYTEAIEDLRKAVALDGGERPLDALANAYLGAEQADLGLMAFEKLHRVAIDTDWKAQAIFGQAQALVMLGRNAEAMRRLEQLSDFDWSRKMVEGAAQMLISVGDALNSELRAKLLELGLEVEPQSND